jgi:hypothetical protein
MNQNMHNWVASILILATVMILQRKKILKEIDKYYTPIFLFINLIVFFISFTIVWFLIN